MTAFTVRVPDAVAEQLDQLAAKLDRSRAYVAAKAIEDFVAREAWQLAEIEAGLAEADRGDLPTPKSLLRSCASMRRPQKRHDGPGAEMDKTRPAATRPDRRSYRLGQP
jgi:predicted transcriptional regulator